MSQQKPAPLSEHCFARFIVWLMALLGWFALGAPFHTKRRFERYGATPIATLRQMVRTIIFIRASEMLPAPPPTTNQARPRDFCAPGFRRRVHEASLRAIFGGALRRKLKHRGSFVEQAAHLLKVLRQHRALARWLADFRITRLTRQRIIIPIAPPAAPCLSLAAPAAAAHDSS